MTYDYECPKCGEVRTVERKITDAEEIYICATCNNNLVRKWSAPTVVFTGTGFYSTDSKH